MQIMKALVRGSRQGRDEDVIFIQNLTKPT
jgi:hypothetical protein